MNKHYRRKMSMYRMVVDILNEYQPVWEGTPKMVSAHGELMAKFELIQLHAEKQRSYTLGVKDARNQLRRSTARLGARIAAALTALGADLQDLELIAQVQISESKIYHNSAGETVILLDRILIRANTYASELVEYGIDEATLNEFIAKRDTLMSNILAPRKAIVKRKDALVKIHLLSFDIDALLRNKIDKMVMILRPTSESFFIEYTSARMILDYGQSANNTTSDDGLV